MQITAHQPAASTIAAPLTTPRQTTLERNDRRRLYPRLYAESQRASDLLLAMFRRRKDSPERDAIWSGYWAVKTERDECVETMLERGCLLHVGAPGALA